MTSTHIDVQSPTSIFLTFAFTRGVDAYIQFARSMYFVSIFLAAENIFISVTSQRRDAREIFGNSISFTETLGRADIS